MKTVMDDSGIKMRKIYSYGQIGSGHNYGVHNADVRTSERALLERIFFCKDSGVQARPFRPSKATVDATLGPARDLLLSHTWFINPYTYDQFVGCYVARKKKIYQHAVDSLKDEEIECKDSYIDAFVKAEKLDLTEKPDPVPRLIQPRRPRYNVEVGRYIKACEHMIFDAINAMWNGTTVFKGLNADARGAAIKEIWDSFVDPVAFMIDASRFDQHLSIWMLSLEHSVYNGIFKSKLLRMLLKWQLKNRGFIRCTDGEIEYVIEGCRASGDMNTSLGNIIVMCLMMYSFIKEHNIDARLIDDGDDCVLVMERHDAHIMANFEAWCMALGFKMVVEEPVDVIEHIKFCQTHPVYINGNYRMVRDPRVTLSKDATSIKPIQHESYHNYLRRAVGECGMALAGDMPVLGAYYSALIRGTSARDMYKRNTNRAKRGRREENLETGMQFLALGMDIKRRVDPSPLTRVSFHEAFGWTPDLQISLEAELDQVNLEWHQHEYVHQFGNLIAGLC